MNNISLSRFTDGTILQSGDKLKPSVKSLENNMQKKEYEVEIGGKKMTAIFSDLADQAHGSVSC